MNSRKASRKSRSCHASHAIQFFVTAINLENRVTRKFDSIFKAWKMVEINSGSIKLIAEGKRKTATSKFNNNKYTFKYFNPHDLDVVKIIKDKISKKFTT